MLLSTLSILDKLAERHLLCIDGETRKIMTKRLDYVVDVTQPTYEELIAMNLIYDTMDVVIMDDAEYHVFKISKDGKRILDDHTFDVKDK